MKGYTHTEYFTVEKDYDIFLWIQGFLLRERDFAAMADRGKGKLPPEESSSSTHRHRRDTVGAQVSASARTEHVPQVSMSVEEQEQEDLFQAQLLSMVGTFQELVKNPRMKKFLKSRREDSQAESS